MYSEVNYLISMLEYCFNNNNPELAKQIINELATHRARITIKSTPKYECASHFHHFHQKSIHKDKKEINYFEKCNHFICNHCMKKYIEDNWKKYKSDHKYVCPGCSALSAWNPSELIHTNDYFNQVIPIEIFERDKNLRLEQLSSEYKTKCSFIKPNRCNITCPQIYDAYGIPSCEHAMCIPCKINYILMWAETPLPELSCIECNNEISHQSIRQSLSTIENDHRFVNNIQKALKKLVLKDILITNCPSCQCLNELHHIRGKQKCQACDHILCCLCGNIFHGNIPCFIAKQRINEYFEAECKADSQDQNLKDHFNHAKNLFSGELHEAGAKQLVEKSGIRLIMKRVTYIHNPLLINNFENLKKNVQEKGGLIDDIYVFHSTSAEIYPEICKNGFKIGGVDIQMKIGKTYGYGIYTAADPTLSINYYRNKKHPRKLLICKAFLGRESKNPMKTPNELKNTEFNSYQVEGQGNRSDIYVFFQREIVLPLYLVEFD